ncbi:SDR family oxidoreductase [Microvirga zambiensis]|uniref:SDR family oxidoreductase n=1 Tax=Microvirga zambiensis TaxID=1402137 RepID=UPI00191E478A|nr:SDR family oxidoreductase [Microvirga zambiensis]
MAGKILVLGATGNVGKPLVGELLAKGEQVKAASRSGKAAGRAEGVRFDFTDETTFAPALDGVDRAYVLAPTGTLDVLGTVLPFVRLAAERKVKIVFQSVSGADANDDIPYRQIEIFIERSGTPYVILRPNWFTDNFEIFWLQGIKHGVISVPAGEGKSAFIDVRDIAASAAAALTTDKFDGQAFNLTGPEALSYGDAAEILSQASGRAIAYKPATDGEFVSTLVSAGVPKAYAEFLAAIFHPVREGWTASVSNAVQTLTGKAPRSVETYARDYAGVFAA